MPRKVHHMTPLSFDYPISVAILYYGGTASDLQDTLESVQGITEALEDRGHMVRTMEVTKKNWRKAVHIPGEVVFNLVEDPLWNLYVKVGEHLERLGRAQVGHDMEAYKYETKKARIKRRLARLNISTPPFRVFNRRSHISQVRGMEYPLIVKPSGEHAGIGISQDSVVIDQQELEDRVEYIFKHFPGEVIAEEYIDGREIHVTILGNGRHIVALPPCEIEFLGEFADNWSVYTYNAKWEKESWEYWAARISLPHLSKKLAKKVEQLAIKSYKAFGCRDVARMDIRLDKNDKPFVVDINMSPSLNNYDVQDATTASVKAIGWSYADFIETIIAITYKRVYGRLPDRTRAREFMLTAPAI